jgi:hypothetical protein
MSDNDNGSASVSLVGLPTLLFGIFLVLKLIGKITWPWIWVLSPLWISAGLGVIASIIFLAIMGAIILLSINKKY